MRTLGLTSLLTLILVLAIAWIRANGRGSVDPDPGGNPSSEVEPLLQDGPVAPDAPSVPTPPAAAPARDTGEPARDASPDRASIELWAHPDRGKLESEQSLRRRATWNVVDPLVSKKAITEADLLAIVSDPYLNPNGLRIDQIEGDPIIEIFRVAGEEYDAQRFRFESSVEQSLSQKEAAGAYAVLGPGLQPRGQEAGGQASRRDVRFRWDRSSVVVTVLDSRDTREFMIVESENPELFASHQGMKAASVLATEAVKTVIANSFLGGLK